MTQNSIEVLEAEYPEKTLMTQETLLAESKRDRDFRFLAKCLPRKNNPPSSGGKNETM